MPCPACPKTTRRRATIEVDAGGVVVGNLYLPNGNSGGEAGYAYKLRWMELLAARAQALLDADTDCVLAATTMSAGRQDFARRGTLPDDATTRWSGRRRERASVRCCGRG